MSALSIETEYAGTRYRSRTEARWAVLFDRAGVGFQYEPEGYKLVSGWYVPDFLLTGMDCIFFEVKGDAPTEREVWLAEDLSSLKKTDVLIASGSPDVDLELIKVHSDKVLPTWVPLIDLFDRYAIEYAQKYRFDWSNFQRARTANTMIKIAAKKLQFPSENFRPGDAAYDLQKVRRA